MTYLVLDKETTVLSKFKRKATPWHPENWVVANGWKVRGDEACSYEYFSSRKESTYTTIPDHITMIIGHNIKFDLLWEKHQGNTTLEAFFKRGGRIWDTQYAEYLIRGQIQKYQMCALNDLAPEYGGTHKVDEVKVLWEAGVNTDRIPKDLLIDYLVGTAEEKRNGGDIRNTEIVFLGQVAMATKQGQIKMIQDRMDGLLCTTEMEWNGIKVDVAEAKRRLAVLRREYAQSIKHLDTFLPEFPEGLDFKWSSNSKVSCLIFGGTIKYTKKARYRDEDGQWVRYKDKAPFPLFNKTPVDPTKHGFGWDRDANEWLPPREEGQLRFKTVDGVPVFWIQKGERIREQDVFLGGKKKGQPKTKIQPVVGPYKERNTDYGFKCEGFTSPDPSWKLKNTDFAGDALYSVGGDTIDALAARGIAFTDALSDRARLDKEISVYYFRDDPKKGPMGMLTCVDPATHIIHHKLNHTSTITSRLSSSDPNLQNVTRGDRRKDGSYKSEVKKMFVSRFGKDGVMLEIDYSQLEVVVQGVLSLDCQLLKDLRNRVDFHCKRVAVSKGVSYEEALEWCKNEDHDNYPTWSVYRTGAKNFSFQRAYGAGANAIALSTGMSVTDVEELIEGEERTYPGIVRFNDSVAESVTRTSTPFQAVDEDTGYWKTYNRGHYIGPTGTRYVFRSYNPPAWMRNKNTTTYSPPEMKNYPVQGTGGEFVQSALGRLWRHFVSKDNYDNRALLINTVHDCVWFDCHKDVVHAVNDAAIEIMQDIPRFYNERYGMNISVPFPVDSEAGYNMLELGHLKENY